MTPKMLSAIRSVSLAATFQVLLAIITPVAAQEIQGDGPTAAGARTPVSARPEFRPIAPDPAAEMIEPTAWKVAVLDVSTVARVESPPIDKDAVAIEDESRSAEGLPPRFAIPNAVLITPTTHGTWEYIDRETLLWRLRITCPGAESINLGFTRYYMPAGAHLVLYAVDGSERTRAFTDADNFDHGELWTPVVLSDDIMVELTIPQAVLGDLQLELGAVNHGYRFFHKLTKDGAEPRAGSCEIDVICPDADGWRNEIPAIGVYTVSGSTICTGFMVNNTAQDQTPYFQTADHCGVSPGNASSVVVYWNFASPTCGAHGGGSLSQYQSGSTFQASWTASDFCLLQLSASPSPSWKISFAGWDRTDTNADNPVAIHHPNGDEKSISFTNISTSITSFALSSSPGDGTHLKVTWQPLGTNRGVTEPGSSGSPIFDSNHRVRGQLDGGYSACGASDMRDWYGRNFKSWTGGGTRSSRLSDWLDPLGSGATCLDTLNPYASGDTAPPTPNPMTFAAAPVPASATSISMIAAGATSATAPPVFYSFERVSGGAGGTKSGWQASSKYTETGLIPNTVYTYRVKARDSATPPNETSYSTVTSAVTAIETPTGITFGAVTSSSIVLNATGSFTNLTTGSSGLYFCPTSVNVFESPDNWVQTTTDTVTGLTPDTQYCFTVFARNQNGFSAPGSAFGAKATLAAVPAAPILSQATPSTMQLQLDAQGNPARTGFAIQCTGSSPRDVEWEGRYLASAGGAGANEVWQTAGAWGTKIVRGLKPATGYTFQAKARNQENVETILSQAAELKTESASSGGLCGIGTASSVVMAALPIVLLRTWGRRRR